MAGTSKILTVSYGAFSCTLEGFDDPIAKMREVAEYYRDLAARDRSFGALPSSEHLNALKELETTRTTHRISADANGETAFGNRAEPVDSEAAKKLAMIKAAETAADTPIETAFDIVVEKKAVAPAPEAVQSPAPQPAEPAKSEAPLPLTPESRVADQTDDAEPQSDLDNAEDMRTAIRGLEAQVAADLAAAEAPSAVIEAESVDVVEAPPAPEAVQPRSSLLSRLKGRFTGESRPRVVAYEDPVEPESRDPIVESATEPTEEEIDPVEAALAQVVAQEQRADRIERRHASTEAAQSDSLDRILEQTNTQLGDNDASRRRSTISQLKAAVAATRARGDDSDDDEKPLNRFREDLQQAVAPEKPAEPPVRRMAPLMLVSDQRVDGSPVDAVAARRTSGNLALAEEESEEASEEIFVDTTPFIEYVATQDVNGLESLTEAAAAFSIYVLGQPHFSRSQLMQFVESAADPSDFSREGFLRAFGTLLRTGSVNKVKRGLFTLARGSRFEP